MMKFHGKGMKDLGADIAYIEPWYQLRRDKGNPNGDLLDYKDPDMGIRELNDNFDEFDVEVGDINGIDVKKAHVKVATGIDENGIRVYMLRDVQANGNSYYTKMLYNYEGRNNPVRKEESVAFLNVASAKLLYRLEQRRKEDLRGSWRPAVVHANDGQFAPLKAVTLSSEYGTSQELKDIFWAFTTHTYGNRWTNTESTNADIRTIPGAIKISLIHMMRIHNTFINAFRQIGYIDYSSGGIRLANWTGAVSNKHRDDVAGKDPNVNMVAVTNGAVPEEMAGIFRDEFNKLQKQGKISETADIERPTAQEVALVKRASKMRFNDTEIKDFNGRNVVIDLKKPMIGYARRLVDEKAGRERAFSNKSIWMMVHLGYNVVLMGNHQGTKESEELAKGLRKLAEEISNAKEQNFENFPGSFQFVESFTPHQKKLFLAAADVQIQDSDNHTGAAEFSEEDITANAGYQGGASFREGVIIDQLTYQVGIFEPGAAGDQYFFISLEGCDVFVVFPLLCDMQHPVKSGIVADLAVYIDLLEQCF